MEPIQDRAIHVLFQSPNTLYGTNVHPGVTMKDGAKDILPGGEAVSITRCQDWEETQGKKNSLSQAVKHGVARWSPALTGQHWETGDKVLWRGSMQNARVCQFFSFSHQRNACERASTAEDARMPLEADRALASAARVGRPQHGWRLTPREVRASEKVSPRVMPAFVCPRAGHLPLVGTLSC